MGYMRDKVLRWIELTIIIFLKFIVVLFYDLSGFNCKYNRKNEMLYVKWDF